VIVLYKDELKELEQRVITKGNLALSPVNIPKVDPIFSYILVIFYKGLSICIELKTT